MYKTLNARKPTVGATDYPVKDHALIDDLKNAANLPGLPFSFKEDTTAGLTLGLYGGQMSINGVLTTIADTTVLLAASQTNYVEHDAAGAVTDNITGFSADKFPIAVVMTDAGSITAYTDRRNVNTMLMPGILSLDVAGAAGTTVLTAAQWANDILHFTGVLTGNRIIEVPSAVSRPKVISNATTGAFSLTVKTNAGTGKDITQGKRGAVYCDSVNVEQPADDAVAVGAVGLTGDQTITGVKRFNGTSTAFGDAAPDNNYEVDILTKAAGKIGLRVRARADQTAVLQEWSGSTGAQLAVVDKDGNITSFAQLSGATAAGAMIASQAEIEAGAAINKLVPPARQHFSPSSLKAWIMGDSAGNILASYNVAGYTDVGVGQVAPVWNTDFSTASYPVFVTPFIGSGATVQAISYAVEAQAAGSVSVWMYRSNGTVAALLDPSYWFIGAAGDQA